MIAVGDETDAEVLLCLQFARLEDVLTYSLDILRCRLYIAPLTTCTVLDEYQISVNREDLLVQRTGPI